MKNKKSNLLKRTAASVLVGATVLSLSSAVLMNYGDGVHTLEAAELATINATLKNLDSLGLSLATINATLNEDTLTFTSDKALEGRHKVTVMTRGEISGFSWG